MTFYNIIFGILFLCAIREVLQAWFDRDAVRFWMSGTLTLLICNDILYTSHLVEEQGVPYTIAMKLSDLVNFVLLSMCVLMLSPTGNLLGVNAQRGELADGRAPLHARREVWFWALICAYWVVCLLWDILGGAYDAKHLVLRRFIPYLFFLPLLAMWMLSYGRPTGRAARLARPIVATITAMYLLVFKAPVIDSMPRTSTKEAVASSPAPQIHPAVPEPVRLTTSHSRRRPQGPPARRR